VVFKVFVTAVAEADLRDIFAHIVRADGEALAGAALERLGAAVLSLARLPARGNHPPELARLGVRAFREIHAAPWRIIYKIAGSGVYVMSVLDARRDVQAQLVERLLRE
jgi:toxin ParE1/3/4